MTKVIELVKHFSGELYEKKPILYVEYMSYRIIRGIFSSRSCKPVRRYRLVRIVFYYLRLPNYYDTTYFHSGRYCT